MTAASNSYSLPLPRIAPIKAERFIVQVDQHVDGSVTARRIPEPDYSEEWRRWADVCALARERGCTLEEIGKASQLTRERIRQVLVKRDRLVKAGRWPADWKTPGVRLA